MKLIRANCITAAARYYLLYNALGTASRHGTVCLLAPAHLFDACDTLWSPTTLSCHSHVSIFFIACFSYVLCKSVIFLLLFFVLKLSHIQMELYLVRFYRFFAENLVLNMYKGVLFIMWRQFTRVLKVNFINYRME